MIFSISADTDNHRYNPIFISADTDKLPIQKFLYLPIPIPITDMIGFVIHEFLVIKISNYSFFKKDGISFGKFYFKKVNFIFKKIISTEFFF